jgi:hypothetical protein
MTPDAIADNNGIFAVASGMKLSGPVIFLCLFEKYTLAQWRPGADATLYYIPSQRHSGVNA